MPSDILGDLGIPPIAPASPAASQVEPNDIFLKEGFAAGITPPQGGKFMSPILQDLQTHSAPGIPPGQGAPLSPNFDLTAQNYLFAPVDAAADVMTGIGKMPFAGLAGLGAMATSPGDLGEALSRGTGAIEAVNAFGRSNNPVANQIVENTLGKVQTGIVEPIARTAGDFVYKREMELSGDPEKASAAAAAYYGAAELGTWVLGAKALKSGWNSVPVRNLRVRERGLVAQTFEEVRAANPDLSLGAFLRKYPQYKERAFADRAATEGTVPPAATPPGVPPTAEAPTGGAPLKANPKYDNFVKAAEEFGGWENIPDGHPAIAGLTAAEQLKFVNAADKAKSGPKEAKQPGEKMSFKDKLAAEVANYGTLADVEKAFANRPKNLKAAKTLWNRLQAEKNASVAEPPVVPPTAAAEVVSPPVVIPPVEDIPLANVEKGIQDGQVQQVEPTNQQQLREDPEGQGQRQGEEVDTDTTLTIVPFGEKFAIQLGSGYTRKTLATGLTKTKAEEYIAKHSTKTEPDVPISEEEKARLLAEVNAKYEEPVPLAKPVEEVVPPAPIQTAPDIKEQAELAKANKIGDLKKGKFATFSQQVEGVTPGVVYEVVGDTGRFVTLKNSETGDPVSIGKSKLLGDRDLKRLGWKISDQAQPVVQEPLRLKIERRGETPTFDTLELAEEDYDVINKSFTSLAETQAAAKIRGEGYEPIKVGEEYRLARDIFYDEEGVDLDRLDSIEEEPIEVSPEPVVKREVIKVGDFSKMGDAWVGQVGDGRVVALKKEGSSYEAHLGSPADVQAGTAELLDTFKSLPKAKSAFKTGGKEVVVKAKKDPRQIAEAIRKHRDNLMDLAEAERQKEVDELTRAQEADMLGEEDLDSLEDIAEKEAMADYDPDGYFDQRDLKDTLDDLMTIFGDERGAINPGGNPEILAAKRRIARDVKKLGQVVKKMEQKIVWHGSPVAGIKKMDVSKVGTGQGAASYGWGLYFADAKAVAKSYHEELARPKLVDANNSELVVNENTAEQTAYDTLVETDFDFNKAVAIWDVGNRYADVVAQLRKWERVGARLSKEGGVYSLRLTPKESEYLLWDTPLAEQSEVVQKAWAKLKEHIGGSDVYLEGMTGKDLYKRLQEKPRLYNSFLTPEERAYNTEYSNRQKGVSLFLKSLGIKGNKYLDQKSRDFSDPTEIKLTEDGKKFIGYPFGKGHEDYEHKVHLLGKYPGILVRGDDVYISFWNIQEFDTWKPFLESRGLIAAIGEIRKQKATYNYVIFDDADTQVVPHAQIKIAKDDINKAETLFERIKRFMKDEEGSFNPSAFAQALSELGVLIKRAWRAVKGAAKATKDYLFGNHKTPYGNYSPSDRNYIIRGTLDTMKKMVRATRIDAAAVNEAMYREMVANHRIVSMHDGKSWTMPVQQKPMVANNRPTMKEGVTKIAPHMLGEAQSPSHIFNQLYMPWNNPVTHMQEATMSFAINTANWQKWAKAILKDFPNQSTLAKEYWDEKYAPIKQLLTSIRTAQKVITAKEDTLKYNTAPAKDALANLKAEKTLLGKKVARALAQMREIHDNNVVEYLSKFPNSKAMYQAARMLPAGVTLSPKEMQLGEVLRTYFDIKAEDLDAVGIPIKRDQNYIIHMIPDILGDPEARHFISETKMPAGLKFRHQSPDSRLWYSDPHQILATYIPVVERKIAYQPFLQRWHEPTASMPEDIQAYMTRWVNANLFNQPKKTWQRAVDYAIAFQYIRTIGFAISPGFKHLPKLIDTLALYDPVTNVKAVKGVMKAVVQNIYEKTGMNDITITDTNGRKVKAGEKRELVELALQRSYVFQKQIGTLIDDLPGMHGIVNDVKWWGSSPTRVVETVENGITVFATLLASASDGRYTPQQASDIIWETILLSNFRSGVDDPLWHKTDAGRIMGMFQITRFKLLEDRLFLARGAVRRESDHFGTQRSTQLFRYLFAIGMLGGAVWKLFKDNMWGILVHPPLVGEGGTLDMAPLAQAYSDAHTQGVPKAISKNFLEFNMYNKIMNIKKGDIPYNRYDSPFEYLLTLPKIGAQPYSKQGGSSSGSSVMAPRPNR